MARMAEDTETAKTVTVACKHPAGLILQLTQEVEIPAADGKTEKMHERIGEPVRINGFRVPLDEKGVQKEVDFTIAGGYGLTSNVSADFWNAWVKQNKEHPMVKNHLLFATASESTTRDQARDQKTVMSNLEPLVPDKDPRIPRRVTPSDVSVGV